MKKNRKKMSNSKELLSQLNNIPQSIIEMVTEEDIVCTGFDIDKLTPDKIEKITRVTAYYRYIRLQSYTKDRAYKAAFKGIIPDDLPQSSLRARANSLESGKVFKQISSYDMADMNIKFAHTTLKIANAMASIALDDGEAPRNRIEAARAYSGMVQLPELESKKAEVGKEIVAELAEIANAIDSSLASKAKEFIESDITAAEILG